MDDNNDPQAALKGFVVISGGAILLLCASYFSQPSADPVPDPTPIPAVEVITVAAEKAMKAYAETMTGNHRQAADMIRAGSIADLNGAHDWLSQRNADGRKAAFRPLGELFNAVDSTPEAAAIALDQAADGYERVFHAIK